MRGEPEQIQYLVETQAGIKGDRVRRHHPPSLPTGELLVSCWCERTVVYVMPDKLKAGLTESCGADGCSNSKGRGDG